MKRLTTLCLALTSLLFAANAQSLGDYQSAGDGNWSDASTWERHNGTMFIAAPSAPDQTDGVISILNGHTITVNSSVTADQIVVDVGGILELTGSFDLNLNDGVGDDLTVNGTWNFSDGYIIGPGNAVITASGTLTLTTPLNKFFNADITNDGAMDLQQGAVYFDAAAVTITNNGTFDISSNNVFTNNLGSGTFINNGTLTNSGTSTTIYGMTVMTNSTGATIKGLGIMDIMAGTFNSNGIIEPGFSPGLVTINTAEPLSANSTLNIEMTDGSGPGTGHDQLARNGNITGGYINGY